MQDISSSDEEIYNPDYVADYFHSESHASCNIDDIQSIIVGGMSSRFWLLRKHMNCFNTKKIKESEITPFYAWNCVTLQLPNRDIDLIIRKEC